MSASSSSPFTSKRPLDDASTGSGSSKRKHQDEGQSEHKQTKRAAQACLTCRKRKLRCLGGWPCKRCAESRILCDFGPAGHGHNCSQAPDHSSLDKADTLNGSNAYARLEQLENSVAALLGHLAGEVHSNHEPDSSRRSRLPSSQYHTQSGPSQPPPSASSITAAPGHSVRFDVMRDDWGAEATPDQSSTTLSGSHLFERHSSRDAKGENQKPEQRLAVATKGVFEPPFKALTYQPSVWDNREPSRRNSPERTQPSSRDEGSIAAAYERRHGRNKDDPINTGIVDPITAEILFDFFMDHCHPFFPIVDIAIDNAFSTFRRSPPLISAITAIAARFYNRYCARALSRSHVVSLDPRVPAKLVNLAEYHLSQTLLRKQHTLSDVQTILLLAAWCLVGEGGGPDAWVMTGHAVRVARRLGVHDVLAQAAGCAQVEMPGTSEWKALERYMPQWRTWLGWLGFDGMFSLGFGRPQSTHLENIDEAIFLKIRLNQSLPVPGSKASRALYGDIYIAGQVRLAHIGRDLRKWGEQLAKVVTDDTSQRSSAINMFKELNTRIDEWFQLWVWSGSPYSLYLGSSVDLSRLQGEHMRLCLNSYALKYSPDQDEFVAECLKKAFNSAVSTVQAHYQSSRNDFPLSFATDYMTITVAQAALFLIRMTKSAPNVQDVVSLDPGVIAYYIQTTIDLLESGDLSETRLSSFLARTIRDISKVADINGMSREHISSEDDQGEQDDSEQVEDNVNHESGINDPSHQILLSNSGNGGRSSETISTTGGNAIVDPVGFGGFDVYSGAAGAGAGGGTTYDPISNPFGIGSDNFFNLDAHSDLGYLLGLQSEYSDLPLPSFVAQDQELDLDSGPGPTFTTSQTQSHAHAAGTGQGHYRSYIQPEPGTEYPAVSGWGI